MKWDNTDDTGKAKKNHENDEKVGGPGEKIAF